MLIILLLMGLAPDALEGFAVDETRPPDRTYESLAQESVATFDSTKAHKFLRFAAVFYQLEAFEKSNRGKEGTILREGLAAVDQRCRGDEQQDCLTAQYHLRATLEPYLSQQEKQDNASQFKAIQKRLQTFDKSLDERKEITEIVTERIPQAETKEEYHEAVKQYERAVSAAGETVKQNKEDWDAVTRNVGVAKGFIDEEGESEKKNQPDRLILILGAVALGAVILFAFWKTRRR